MSGGRLGIWTMAAALTWLVAGCAPANPDAPPQQAQDLPLLSSAADSQDRQAAADDLPGASTDVPLGSASPLVFSSLGPADRSSVDTPPASG
jgi:hypothetical protein